MTPEIIVALIAGGVSVLGVVLTNNSSNKILQEQIKELTHQVEKHNSVIERTYEAEKQIDVLKEKQRVANHRIDDLENKINS
ncbi:hypothetical protein [uncultured Eubacterium sp.]|uniref:hypothetical protein n=1 Tax=uncultured Eubacterium sp. TaxID=165185 RepID=UPI0025E08719|nr:hypothetical protein [uncultured Eubacterium sp.]